MPDITWVGSVDGDFTNKNNWIVTSTGATAAAAPANSDTLRWNDLSTASTTVNITSTALTGLTVVVTLGFMHEIGTGGDALEADISTFTYAGSGKFGKFNGTIPSPKVEAGLCLFTGGTVGATSLELSNATCEIGASATAGTGTWKLKSGLLSLLETATGDEPDIWVAPSGRVNSSRDLGDVYNAGRVMLDKAAEIEAAHAFWNLPGGRFDFRSNGTIPTLDALPGSHFTIANAHRVGAITTLNEWDGADVELRGPGGAITPGTHNYIGKPPVGLSSPGAGGGLTTGGSI